eukprot:IDg12839t1
MPCYYSEYVSQPTCSYIALSFGLGLTAMWELTLTQFASLHNMAIDARKSETPKIAVPREAATWRTLNLNPHSNVRTAGTVNGFK